MVQLVGHIRSIEDSITLCGLYNCKGKFVRAQNEYDAIEASKGRHFTDITSITEFYKGIGFDVKLLSQGVDNECK